MAAIFSVLVLLCAAAVFGGAAWLGFSGLTFFRGDMPALLANVILPTVFVVASLAALRLRRDWRTAVALCLVALVPAFYAAEWVIESQIEVQRRARPHNDPRTKIEVIRDLRRSGDRAYPVMRAKSLLVADDAGTLRPVLGGDPPDLPLASLPDTTVVSCNETGRWLVYRSDAHGFHNPPEAWTAGAPRIMLVGDSFAHGSCVASDANMAARLRARAGPVLNLGVSGFGPLSVLATLREYGRPMRPGVVVWAFFEGNDLNDDLPFERRSPLLRRYMSDPSFTQNLFGRRDAWAGRLRAYLDARLEEAMGRFDNPHQALLDFLQLFHLRERFGLGPLSLGVVPADLNEQIAYFDTVAARVKEEVAGWGGRLVIAYLPESARYFAAAHNGEIRSHIHDAVLRTAKRHAIPLVDLSETFDRAPDPRRLFVYPGSHYSADGYALAADAVAAVIDALPATTGN